MKRFLLLLCAIALAWPASLPQQAEAQVSEAAHVDFACAPGQPILQHRPLQRVFSYAVKPGTATNDMLAVLNLSKGQSFTFKLSVSDAVTPPQGAGVAYNDGPKQHAVGQWIHLGQTVVTVAPRQLAYIPLNVSIPPSVAPGEYQGSINVTDQQPITVTQGTHKLSLLVTDRCAVQMRVTGRASAGFEILHAGFVKVFKKAAFALTLRNSGTVIAQPMTTTVTFVRPHKTYTFHLHIGSILGGSSTAVAWALGRGVPAGSYKAHVEIVYQAHIVYGAPPQQLRASWSGDVVVPTV